MADERIADALYVPKALRAGKRMVDRVYFVSLIAEPLLGVDYAAGERALIRVLPPPADKDFVTKHLHDTQFFPDGHPHARQPRYRWEPPDDRGIERGYLLE